MSGKISGFTEDTLHNVTTGAAVVYRDFDITTDTVATAAAKIISATKGGVTIKIEPDSWAREIDGVPENTVGIKEVDSIKPSIEFELVEVNSPAAFAASLGAADVSTSTTPSGYHVVTPRHGIEAADYAENITVITQTKNGKPMIIQVFNPLSDEGGELATEAKAGGSLKVVFVGNYSADDLETVPIKIYTADE